VIRTSLASSAQRLLKAGAPMREFPQTVALPRRCVLGHQLARA